MFEPVRDLPRLRLPVPPHRRRRRALVPQRRRAAERGRARGHVPDAPPVAARRRSGRAVGPRGRGRPAAGALHPLRPPAHRAAARLRARRLRPPGAPRAPLRRRPHRLVPLLLPARGGFLAPRGAASGWSSTGTSCGRARTGATTSGRAGGWVGWRVQRACARIPQRAFCFSRLHAERLRAEGVRGEVTVLEGEFAGAESDAQVEPYVDSDLVVFAGRHIPEKRVPALVPALAGRCRACARRSTATGPSAGACWR